MKRRKNIPALPFSEHSELPCMVPEGERWTQCIANRAFKTRVIDLVLLRLPHVLLKAGAGNARKRLIVDYHQPREYWFDQEGGRVEWTVIDELEPMGEADVKFTRYADRYDKLMVDSIDGDSIPIALMHLERELRRTPPQRISQQVSVYRLELHAPTPAAGKKREASGEEKKSKRRTYEFVNINALYQALLQAIAQCTGRVTIPTHQGHEMAMLVGLIALTGTDFTRHLPQLSGKSVFSYLPDIWPTVAMAYDTERGALRVEETTNLLVARLYSTKFPKHTRAGPGDGLAGVLASLKGAKEMSDRLKTTLPSVDRIMCTVRNSNWLLAYWTCEPRAPDPIQPMYGFRVLANGATEYDEPAGA
jgi:hypothetical protein